MVSIYTRCCNFYCVFRETAVDRLTAKPVVATRSLVLPHSALLAMATVYPISHQCTLVSAPMSTGSDPTLLKNLAELFLKIAQ